MPKLARDIEASLVLVEPPRNVRQPEVDLTIFVNGAEPGAFTVEGERLWTYTPTIDHVWYQASDVALSPDRQAVYFVGDIYDDWVGSEWDDFRAIITKLDRNGNLLWELITTVDLGDHPANLATAVAVAANGDVYVHYTTAPFVGYLMRLNPSDGAVEAHSSSFVPYSSVTRMVADAGVWMLPENSFVFFYGADCEPVWDSPADAIGEAIAYNGSDRVVQGNVNSVQAYVAATGGDVFTYADAVNRWRGVAYDNDGHVCAAGRPPTNQPEGSDAGRLTKIGPDGSEVWTVPVDVTNNLGDVRVDDAGNILVWTQFSVQVFDSEGTRMAQHPHGYPGGFYVEVG